jgi:hypothetical protein
LVTPHDQRIVAKTVIEDAEVSTVFISQNTNIHGPPMVFETMVFGGGMDGYQTRHPTWEQAEHGHAAVVAMVYAALGRAPEPPAPPTPQPPDPSVKTRLERLGEDD